MQKNTIHREKSGLFSELSNALTYNQEKFASLITTPFSVEAFTDQIERKSPSFTAEKRTVLVETLRRQYTGFTPESAVTNQIESLLSPTTFTVTTGHQLNLLTGPIYFIYKILHVIRLAELLKQQHPTKHFVPVYWMASEDHDFEEINHTRLFGKNIRWENAQGGPVGEYALQGWEELQAEIESFFQNKPESEALHVLRSYQGKDLAHATKALVHRLFAHYGLVIVEPNDTDLKREFASIMIQEIETQFAQKAVLKSNHVLEEMGFKPQVHARPINLFYIEKGVRERLVDEDGRISIAGKGVFSTAELTEQVKANPERFSPNVVLRPVYQECILPNLAYVGGGGEMAYWLQFKGVFEAASVPYPLIQVRNSLQLIDANSQKKLTKLGLQTAAIFSELEDLKKKYIFENSGETLDFSALEGAVKVLETQLQKSILDVDSSLSGFASAEIVKLQKQIENVQSKLVKQQKAKFDGAMKQLEDVKEKLFPQNGVQERKDNFFSFCASGDVFPFLDLLKDAIDPLEKDLIVVELD